MIFDSTAVVIQEPIVGSGGGGGCFRAGTRVQLEGGWSQGIETLKEGDEVLAFDEQGDIHLAKITKLHIHTDPQPILKVRFWNGVIFITPNHWVLNQYGAFVEIGTLTEHDAVVDEMGHLRPIISKELVSQEEVYNLTVEPFHTFIADGIRVHNGGHRERYPVVTGSGGNKSAKGSGGGGGRAAIEDGDTLESKASIKIIDLLGEGPIGGLVYTDAPADKPKSIYLNNTPLMNGDGLYNFTNVSWDNRDGYPNQALIPGFSTIESPYTINNAGSTLVTHSVPAQFTVFNVNADRIRVIVNVLSLISHDMTTGDIHGSSVTYHFELTTNGVVTQLGSSTVTGKTKSKYQRSHVFTLPKPLATNTWTLKMVRDTAGTGSDSATISNVIELDSYVEIVDVKINYANSALVSIGVDPKTFSSVPGRSYLVDGLFIQVPFNRSVNTTTNVATYTGVWNGNFKPEVSSNPAWILYDLLTNKRYGLGNYLDPTQIDTAMLYTIGRYCDDMVDNGLNAGTNEPRFTINTQIQTQAEAYKLISDITSVFRGMAYWNGGMVCFRQDSPQTPSMVFNQANVIDGEFSYASSSRKDRHSVVNVTWNDPLAGYKQRIEHVEDHDLVILMGVKKFDTVAFGCTSRGQANRVGRWILYTEKYEQNLITFKVGLDSSLLLPGEVVRISDAFKSGKRSGGRAISSTLTSLVADSLITLSLGSGLTAVGHIDIFIAMKDGSFAQRTINQTSGNVTTITWNDPLKELPIENAVFVLSDAVVPSLARILSVAQDGTNATHFIVTAVSHNPDKYGAVESSMLLKIPQTSISQPYIASVSNIAIDETTYFIAPGTIGSKLHISWSGRASAFRIAYRVTIGGASSNWLESDIATPSFDIEGLAQTSIIDIRISAKSIDDVWTAPVLAQKVILGKSAAPLPPTSLVATSGYGLITLKWINSADIDFLKTVVYMSTGNNSATATVVGETSGDTFVYSNPISTGTLFFWAKTVDTSGNFSAFNAVSGTSASQLTVDLTSWSKTGIVFSANAATHTLSWTSGTILKNASTSFDIAAGSLIWSSQIEYIYFNPLIVNPLNPTTPLSHSLTLSVAVATGNYPLATYSGGDGSTIKGGDGSAFISGSQLIAGTVGAAQLVAGEIISNSAQIKNAIINDAHIVALSGSKITTANLSSIQSDLGTIRAGILTSPDSTSFIIDLNNKFILIQ